MCGSPSQRATASPPPAVSRATVVAPVRPASITTIAPILPPARTAAVVAPESVALTTAAAATVLIADLAPFRTAPLATLPAPVTATIVVLVATTILAAGASRPVRPVGDIAIATRVIVPSAPRTLIRTDAQLATAEGGPAQRGQLLLAQRGADLHQGEGLEDIDLADVSPRDTALVGERPHDRAGQDPVAVSDLDAVDGAGAVIGSATPAGGTGLVLWAVRATATTIAAPLEGGGYEGALIIEMLFAPRAPVGLALATARSVIAHGQSQQGGGELVGIDAQSLRPGGDQSPVQRQASALP